MNYSILGIDKFLIFPGFVLLGLSPFLDIIGTDFLFLKLISNFHFLRQNYTVTIASTSGSVSVLSED